MTGTATTALTGHDLAASIAGALDIEVSDDGVRAWRLPPKSRRYAPATLSLMAEFCAGVRLRLLTAASTIEIEATVTRLVQRGERGAPAPAPFVTVVDGHQVDRADVAVGPLVREREDRTLERDRDGTRSRFELRTNPGTGDPARPRLVEVWLPADAGVLLHRVSAATALQAAAVEDLPRWLHYGSSISHGGGAGSPLATWPRLAAVELGVAGTNLGFGGNAMLDISVARAIAAAPADAITLKVGINIVGADAMRQRTFVSALHAFIDTIREGHRSTPIGLITAIACPAVETVPGPIRAASDGAAVGTPRELRVGDGTLTLSRSRELIRDIVATRAADDAALHLVDGLALLSADEQDRLPDGLHPDRRGHELIARRFASMARTESTAAGRVFAGVLHGRTATTAAGPHADPR